MNEDTQTLETNLRDIVLSQYRLPKGKITWQSHDNIGPDDMAHYFSLDDQKYVLVWSDFPNSTFIHEESLTPVMIRDGKDEWLHIKDGDAMGYYSLYEDY